jgi:Mg2+ and Co2+ transporter CorA
VFSMIFLPLTIFTSLFDLGLTQIIEPLQIQINGGILFFAIIFSMIVSVTGMLIIFRRRGWIYSEKAGNCRACESQKDGWYGIQG